MGWFARGDGVWCSPWYELWYLLSIDCLLSVMTACFLLTVCLHHHETNLNST